MLKITDYADKLLEGLEEVNFAPRVKLEQQNWIGRSYGAEIEFGIENKEDKLKIYTTRPDTIYGVTYMAIAPEHPLLEKYKDEIKNYDEIEKYKEEASKKSEFERVELAKTKTGVKVDGLNVINPINNKSVPLWVTDYVMMGYGTGAIMAVPAHDTRDYEFAKKFGIDMIQVVASKDNKEISLENEAYTDIEDGIAINSEIINGLPVKEAKEKMIDYIEEKGFGTRKKNYHMKDWAFARQRYWGEPVPIVKCPHCGLVPLPEEELPLKLPEVENFVPGEDGESPLAKVDSWVNVKCPKCGADAKRETDTMPQWAGSSWYFLRYMDPNNNDAIASKEALNYWGSVDCYNGGMEHVTRHLIYSRFWHRFLYDIGVVPTKEPYQKRTTQGLILAEDGSKMSKSKGNVVNPDDIVKEYGADTLRTYILFIGDYGMAAPWSENGVKGAKKFLDRVMRIESLVTDEDISSKELDRELNVTIKKATEDFEDMKYNTAIAQMMSYVNVLYKQDKVSKKYVKPLLQILNPVAPHVTEELWQKLGFEGYIFESKWPSYDETKLVADEIEIPVQINGKIRYKINVPSDSDEKAIEDMAKSAPALQNYLEGKEIKKVIVIKSKIVNIVLG